MNLVTHETAEQFSRALGEAVVRNLGRLPHEVQRFLFAHVISSHGEGMRPQLAMFLHETHPRTCAAIQARAMPEPDSLGG
jgi:hypothetical protein